MLSKISWHQYGAFLLATTFIYYIIVIFIFYRNSVILLFSRLNNGTDHDTINITDYEETNTLSSKLTSPALLQNEITLLLEEGAKRNLIKEEIMMSLQVLLANNNSLKFSPEKNTINDYIIKESENICSIHLNEVTVNQLWER